MLHREICQRGDCSAARHYGARQFISVPCVALAIAGDRNLFVRRPVFLSGIGISTVRPLLIVLEIDQVDELAASFLILCGESQNFVANFLELGRVNDWRTDHGLRIWRRLLGRGLCFADRSVIVEG